MASVTTIKPTTADKSASLQARNHEARLLVAAGWEDEIPRLCQLDDKRRWPEILFFAVLWPCGAATTLLTRAYVPSAPLQWLGTAAGIFISAIALNAFALLLHDGMHHTLLSRPWLNRWVSVLLGAPVLISYSAYQVMHLRHHHFLGDPRDPDDYDNYSSSRWLVWLMHFVRLAVGAFLYLALIPVLAWRRGSAQQRRNIAEEYALLGTIYVTAALLLPREFLIWGWGLPIVVVAYMTNIRGFTQHGITNAHDPLLASRSMLVPRPVAFCLLNENFHLEHHLFPEVPSYHLPQLHERIWPRLPRAVSGRSYLAFLSRFLVATWRLDPSPIGLVHPAAEVPGTRTLSSDPSSNGCSQALLSPLDSE